MLLHKKTRKFTAGIILFLMQLIYKVNYYLFAAFIINDRVFIQLKVSGKERKIQINDSKRYFMLLKSFIMRNYCLPHKRSHPVSSEWVIFRSEDI